MPTTPILPQARRNVVLRALVAVQGALAAWHAHQRLAHEMKLPID